MDFVKVHLRVIITGELITGYIIHDLDKTMTIHDNGMYRTFWRSQISELEREVITL